MPTGLLKSDHFLHLRCELPAVDMVGCGRDRWPTTRWSRMVSLMDHSPGIGQYRDMARYRVLRQKQQQMSDAAVDARIAELLERRARLREPQRRWLLDRLAHRDLPLASHDDDEIAEVAATPLTASASANSR